jgi:hypothetical protein
MTASVCYFTTLVTRSCIGDLPSPQRASPRGLPAPFADGLSAPSLRPAFDDSTALYDKPSHCFAPLISFGTTFGA